MIMCAPRSARYLCLCVAGAFFYYYIYFKFVKLKNEWTGDGFSRTTKEILMNNRATEWNWSGRAAIRIQTMQFRVIRIGFITYKHKIGSIKHFNTLCKNVGHSVWRLRECISIWKLPRNDFCLRFRLAFAGRHRIEFGCIVSVQFLRQLELFAQLGIYILCSVMTTYHCVICEWRGPPGN